MTVERIEMLEEKCQSELIDESTHFLFVGLNCKGEKRGVWRWSKDINLLKCYSIRHIFYGG